MMNEVVEPVTIRGTIRLVVVPLLVFALIAVSASIPNPMLHALWLAVAVGFFGFLFVRTWRAGVTANRCGVEIRNIGRTVVLPWADVRSISVVKSNNVTGMVRCVVVHREDGTGVIARAASSYSRNKVEGWTAKLEAARPGT